MECGLAVIVPVYNGETYLRECLDSLLWQSFPNWQGILVDDGSTDQSGAICEEYAARDSRFQVIHQPNQGLPAARNAGMEHLSMSCRRVLFLDSDDCLASDLLETVWMYDQKNPDRLLSWRVCDNMQALAVGPADLQRASHYTKNEMLEFFFTWMLGAVWNKAYPVSLIRAEGLRFDPTVRFSEDIEFNFRFLHCLFTHDARSVVDLLPEAMYFYRPNPRGMTGQVNTWYAQQQFRVFLPVYMEWREFYGLTPDKLLRFDAFLIQTLGCGLANIYGKNGLRGKERRRETQALMTHPLTAHILADLATWNAYSPYALPLRQRCAAVVAWLFRMEHTRPWLYGKLYWVGFYLKKDKPAMRL